MGPSVGAGAATATRRPTAAARPGGGQAGKAATRTETDGGGREGRARSALGSTPAQSENCRERVEVGAFIRVCAH